MARKKTAPNLIVAPRYETDTRCIRGVRVSEGRERGHTRISEDVQDRKTLKLTEAFGLEEVWFYQELGVSGDAERAALEEALRKIENHEAAWLVVTEVDRLGRDVRDIHDTFHRVHAAGGCVLIGEPLLKSVDESAQIVLAVLAQLAQSQRVKIARKWNDAQADAWERGIYPGDVPFGFRNPGKGEIAERPGHPALLHSSDAAKVREAVRALVDDQVSWPRAAAILGLSTQGTRALFANRTLLGEVHWKGRPVVVGAHDPLISLSDFETINGRRTTSLSARENHAQHLGAGTLRCAGCRHALHHRTSKSANAYYCRNKSCPDRVMVLPAAETDALLKQLAEEAHGALESITFNAEEAGSRTVAEVDGDLNDARVRERQFAKLLAARPGSDALLESFDAIASEIKVLNAERAVLVAATASLRTTLMSTEVWDATDIAGRIDAVRSVLDAVFVRADGTMFPHTLGTYSEPLPSKGRRVAQAPYVPVPVGVQAAA